ncbi:MAG TPA: hypothetical protein VMD91_11800 [Candidatus Sulfotelmatobacter sp.]|nr:hypothetical protein [Candidatus Sulfotelmatobacter sp.]
MRTRWLGALGLMLVLAAPAAAVPGITVVDRGSCVVAGGIRNEDGTPAKAWDMWQEIYQTGAPTWLQAHTHHGAECITNVSGVTSWWFAHRVPSRPASAPTIVPAHNGLTVYTVQGRVHTAGDVGPGNQAYLGIHLLVQGSDFNYPVNDPSAPPLAKTGSVSIFKNEFPNQVPSPGTLTIANQILRFAPHAAYPIPASGALGYYTFFAGSGTLRMRGVVVAMATGKTLVVPRNTAATITANAAGMLAATELVPGAHP